MPMHEPSFDTVSTTTVDQFETEEHCARKIKLWLRRNDIFASTTLNRRQCIDYISRGLRSLSAGYSSLDCSRTWICYWLSNSLNLLSAEMHLTRDVRSSLIAFLGSCQHRRGGFGGGPLQNAHLAATFGAIMALLSLGSREAYDVIDRKSFYDFVSRQKQSDGSFSVNDGGEIDIRAAYCGLACASVLNVLDEALCKNTLEWIRKCQTFQGGFAQEPGDEAHGGYAYCAVATVFIIASHFPHLITKENEIEMAPLIRWHAMAQMQFAGGFQGRTHKLVDACYSFWVGAVFPIMRRLTQLRRAQEKDDDNKSETETESESLFSSLQLQKYLLVCCQWHGGGITDKPPKPADYYHTCYGLSGLSVAQHYDGKLFGPATNKLEAVDPIYGIEESKLVDAWTYFREIDSGKEKETETETAAQNETQSVDEMDVDFMQEAKEDDGDEQM